ncbi:hypothetical protein SAMN06269185_1818 [Natronoarchaeum philippinense]|uniref:Uncharacterized protein n=1 Tax=Natronoarchaeum philippinense TaxID=558529 RepID=A0A285NUI5_NATPI|nr:hypothetical protein [Natronoarchaeum philippinense]SNZ12583.1 hypothetical protein SAMN06269185_1818 [Natronoarchaeum philippinense]
MSLLYDLLTSVFVDPLFEYFVHDLTLGRIVTRLIASVALLGGIYLALLQPAPLSYVGWALAVPAGLFTAYDALTVNRHTRS